MVSFLETMALVLEEEERIFVKYIHLLFVYSITK